MDYYNVMTIYLSAIIHSFFKGYVCRVLHLYVHNLFARAMAADFNSVMSFDLLCCKFVNYLGMILKILRCYVHRLLQCCVHRLFRFNLCGLIQCHVHILVHWYVEKQKTEA